MNARRAARELALLTLFQMSQKDDASTAIRAFEKNNVRDLMLNAVRGLVDYAREQAQTAAEDLADVSRAMIEMEQEHPENLATPLDAEVKPVAIPTSREMIEKIEVLLQSAEMVVEALRIPTLVAHAQSEEVQNYALRLIQLVHLHQKEVDEQLNQYADDWRIDRLVKMDHYILLLAACEMRYVKDVDLSVSINEAVELAKQYSTQESHRFINGLLGKVADVLQGKVVETSEDSSEIEAPPPEEVHENPSEDITHV